MKIRLGDEDRARLDCPEWLDWDGSYLIDEAIELEEQAGISPEEFENLVRGKPQFAEGQPVLDDKGRQVFKRRTILWKVIVWCALRRASVTVPWSDLTFDVRSLATQSEAGEDDDTEDKTPDAG